MKTRKLKFKVSDFKKVHSALKKLEASDKKVKINGLSISDFLIANLSIDDETDSPVIRTKRIILQIAGDYSSNPAELNDNIKLTLNLFYSDNEYSLLQMRLNSLVKEYKKTANITDDETIDCATVGDCTELVISKIN